MNDQQSAFSGQRSWNPLVVIAICARIAEWKKEQVNDQVRGVALKMRAVKRSAISGQRLAKGSKA